MTRFSVSRAAGDHRASAWLSRSAALCFFVWSGSISAASIGGVEFPQGEISFADAVVDYSPVIKSGDPTEPHQDPDNALGTPDYDGVFDCADQESCTFVSLGDGGSIVVQFVDNFLTGSGTSDDDLWIFEVGPQVEDMAVDISFDGTDWFSVGTVGGSTAGVDIDAFGYDETDLFRYVRLTDDETADGQSGNTVGADIDAVGAISTQVVPLPAAAWLMISALGLLATLRTGQRAGKL